MACCAADCRSARSLLLQLRLGEGERPVPPQHKAPSFLHYFILINSTVLLVFLSRDDNFINSLCKGWITDTYKQQNIWLLQDRDVHLLHKALQ